MDDPSISRTPIKSIYFEQDLENYPRTELKERRIIMKNRISLVIIGIIIIFVIGVVYYGIAGVYNKGGPTATENPITTVPTNLTNQNTTPEKTASPELLNQLILFSMHHKDFGIHKWEYGPNKDEITLYAYAIKNESQIENLQGTKINNYTIRIIHDTEFERKQYVLVQELTLIQQDRRYQIDHFYTVVDPFGNNPENTIELWVDALTSENRKLDNTKMDGWKVVVYPMSTPVPTLQNEMNNAPEKPS
jgi:hypothetical protein